MLGALQASFTRCGHEVIVPGAGDFGDEIRRLAPVCDAGLVIAPDHLLSRYTVLLEQLTDNLGCGSMAAAVCANKEKTKKILARHGIPVPGSDTDGLRVIKPATGCGAQGVRLSDAPAGSGEFSEAFIDGENLSVSIVCNRVVGEACLNFTGEPPVVLAVNRQFIRRGPDGTFHYEGGETPVNHPRSAEIRKAAADAAGVLGCQGYCGVDIVLSDKAYVIEVNPRITTSIVGIAACLQEEIAEILIAASHGKAPHDLHFSGTARFGADGTVIRR